MVIFIKWIPIWKISKKYWRTSKSLPKIDTTNLLAIINSPLIINSKKKI